MWALGILFSYYRVFVHSHHIQGLLNYQDKFCKTSPTNSNTGGHGESFSWWFLLEEEMTISTKKKLHRTRCMTPYWPSKKSNISDFISIILSPFQWLSLSISQAYHHFIAKPTDIIQTICCKTIQGQLKDLLIVELQKNTHDPWAEVWQWSHKKERRF